MGAVTGLKELEGTNLIIAGRREFDLGDPRNVGLLQQKQVKQVFMIFLGEVIEGQGYSESKQKIEQALIDRGIMFMPLQKEPTNVGSLETFDRQVNRLKGGEKALLLCYHGLHNSAAYATYHLLKKGMGYDNVSMLLKKSGWSEGSIGTVKTILAGAGVNVYKFGEQFRNAAIRRATLAGRVPNPQAAQEQHAKHEAGMKKLKDFLKKMHR